MAHKPFVDYLKVEGEVILAGRKVWNMTMLEKVTKRRTATIKQWVTRKYLVPVVMVGGGLYRGSWFSPDDVRKFMQSRIYKEGTRRLASKKFL